MTASLSKAARRRQAAFSLVEICMSIGIVSFAFLSILGLLPLGMTTFQGAIDRSMGIWISQQIVGEVQQTDFNTYLTNQEPLSVRYFDVDGGELKSASGAAVAGAIYQVNVWVAPAPTLPGANNANENLATVTVQIANNPANHALERDAENLWVARAGVSMTTYSTVIAGYRTTALAGN